MRIAFLHSVRKNGISTRDTGMRKVFKWLTGTVAVLVLIAAVAVVVLYAALRSTIPADEGAAGIAGLSRWANIVRDENAVPHIEAENINDAVTALGYAHAQDRFWQMHTLRMVAQGRLSELFGKPTIDTDIFLRTIDISNASQKSFESLSDETQLFLRSYADGVNAWLDRETGLLETRLPPEFLILGKDAEPWEPWHSISILKVMALTLDSNLSEEINRLALVSKGFSSEEIDELVPYGPRDNPPPLPDLRKLYGGGQSADLQSDDPSQFSKAFDLPWEIGITASNNWVVSGNRSQSGAPLLANDPHLGLTSPSIFYLAHLRFGAEGEERNLVGGTLPGAPLFVTGRNDHLAWGLTTTNLDAQDLFIERVKADDPAQYLTPFGWRDFDQEEIEIAVSGAEPVRFTRRVTRHGPVLPDGYRDLASILPPGTVGAVQWSSLADDDTTMEGLLEVNLATSAQEFVEATRKVVAPMQSIVYASTDGDIGIIAPARVPVRDPGNLVAGRAPVPGWYSVYDWKGWLAHEDLPQILNPGEGAIATANANWMPAGYSHHITYDWAEHFRQARVEERIVQADKQHSPETMKAAQGDDFSPALSQFRDEAFAQLEAGAGQDPKMLDAMRNWDGRMVMDSPVPLIMTSWWRHTQMGMFGDDLGEDYTRFANGNLQVVLNALTVTGARDWCDDQDTTQLETCGIILSRALSATLDELRVQYGNDWTSWRWGFAHRALGEHRPFSSVGPLARFFTVAPESAGGAYTLLRGRMDFSDEDHYRNVHASAFRGWYDLAEPDRAGFIISTGQSGHFLSPHYDDLADDWAELRYIEIPTQPSVYEENAKGIWILSPQ